MPFRITGELIKRKTWSNYEGHFVVQLIMRDDDGFQVVFSNLREFRGYVNIDSGQQALNFARLGTSLQTGALLSSQICTEVVDRSILDPTWTFGDLKALEFWKSLPNGTYGVLDHDIFTRHTDWFARVKATGTGFVIKRTLLCRNGNDPHDNTLKLARVLETVSRAGDYERAILSEAQVSPVGRIKWSLPRPH